MNAIKPWYRKPPYLKISERKTKKNSSAFLLIPPPPNSYLNFFFPKILNMSKFLPQKLVSVVITMGGGGIIFKSAVTDKRTSLRLIL